MKEVLDLNSESAATIFSFIKIQRDNPRDELGIIELENSISQAIWKMFDGIRGEISGRLGVDEADLLLADARVIGIKIDGHQIINPSGFTGHELEILLAVTIVRRDKFVEDRALFEGGSVRAYLIAKERGFADALYVEVGDEATTIFSITPTGVSYVRDFEWGVKDIIESITKELGVMMTTADGIYDRHARGVVSEHVGKKLDKIFYDAFADFVGGVTLGVMGLVQDDKAKLPPIYLNTFFPVPEGLQRKRFALGNKQVRFLPPAVETNITQFADDDVHNIYDELNQLAKRRIKWLMPAG